VLGSGDTPRRLIRVGGVVKKENVVEISRDWWKEEREPTESNHLIVKKKRKLPTARVFTIQELARKYQSSADVFYKAIRAGELEALPVGRIWRVPEEALLDYFERQSRKKGIA
jgi:excisionase family DNA binding protein